MSDLTADMLYARTHDQVCRGEFGASDALYAHTRAQGRRRRFWSGLRGRSCNLLDLAELEAACTVQARRHAGLKTVPLSQILGSESRSSDFDRGFNPLQDHNRGRWQRIARARQQGTVLPPVDLIQAGHVYFVRDGHHRISVARSMGQLDIEAEVIVWQVDGPPPWHTRAAVPSATGQETATNRLFKRAGCESARLRDRFLLNLRHLWIAIRPRLREQVLAQTATGR